MKRLLLLILTISLPAMLRAQKEAVIAQGPYIQACGQNEFTVVWQTDVDAVSWVEIAPDDGTHFYNIERPKYYQTIHGRRPIGRLHCVTVTGLEPGTKYRYRIFQRAVLSNQGRVRVLYSAPYGSDILSHKPYCVRTLDAAAQTTRFAVGNDFHEAPDLLRKLFDRETVNADNYDFVLYNGDMVTSIDSEEYLLQNVITPSVDAFAADMPLFMARGNHENRGQWGTHYMDYFPTSSGTPYYTFRSGPAFCIVLDGGEDKPDSDIRNLDLMISDPYREQEAEWLRGVVSSEEFRSAPVRIVFLHMPPSPKGWHGGAEISRLFVPILNQAGIDLMLSAHIHGYKLYPAGHKSTGCTFPVLCNPNRTRMDVEATAGRIECDIFDKEGKLTHSDTFATGQRR